MLKPAEYGLLELLEREKELEAKVNRSKNWALRCLIFMPIMTIKRAKIRSVSEQLSGCYRTSGNLN